MSGMKFSFIIIDRISFQSVLGSPSKRQTDSNAVLTCFGGLRSARISTRCSLLMAFTAVKYEEFHTKHVMQFHYLVEHPSQLAPP